jgi:cysteine dioxygenase
MDILLKTFIDRLESLPDKVSLDELKKCVREENRKQLPVAEYIVFSDQEYKRNIVHVSNKCEVTVLCFKRGQFTPIHDHGSSIGITIIKAGTMTEELFNKQPTGMVVPTFTRRFRSGEMSYVNLTTIHRVSNAHLSDLVTINIYFPPLTLMNIYNKENAKIEKWVADYSGRKT